ncbi:hypothetical protein ACE41L_29080, partial [Bacillus cereus]
MPIKIMSTESLKKLGIITMTGSLLFGSAGCSWFSKDKDSSKKTAVTKKVDKDKKDKDKKKDEKKENLDEKDFAAITENAITSNDKDVAYVLDIDKNKVNFKDKSLVSNIQNNDDTNNRVLALFDQESSRNIGDFAKDNVIAAIDNKGSGENATRALALLDKDSSNDTIVAVSNNPRPTVDGDNFAFGGKDLDSSLVSIGDVVPKDIIDGNSNNGTSVEPIKPPISEGNNGGVTDPIKPPINGNGGDTGNNGGNNGNGGDTGNNGGNNGNDGNTGNNGGDNGNGGDTGNNGGDNGNGGDTGNNGG